MKTAFLIAIRLVAVTVLYFICFAAVSAALLSPPTKQLAEPQTSEALVPLLTVSFLISAVFAYVIVRSRWTGWKLILTIFFVFYGVITYSDGLRFLCYIDGATRKDCATDSPKHTDLGLRK